MMSSATQPQTDRTTIIACGSPGQTADTQASMLRRDPALAGVNVIAVTTAQRGFLCALAGPTDRWMRSEVADVYGLPVDVSWLLRADGTAVIDAAQLVTADREHADANIRLVATSYGIGQLLVRARFAGATTAIVGADGFPGGDAGTGAANAAGARLTVANGSGLKIGANELGDLTGFVPAEHARTPHVVLLCDTARSLAHIASSDDPRLQFADLIKPLYAAVTPDTAYTGACDGLAFGFATVFGGELVDAATYAVGLHDPQYATRKTLVLVGSKENLLAVAGVYEASGGHCETYVCDRIDRDVVRALVGAVKD